MKNLIIYVLSILITVMVSIIGFATYLMYLTTEGMSIEIKEGTVFMKYEE